MSNTYIRKTNLRRRIGAPIPRSGLVHWHTPAGLASILTAEKRSFAVEFDMVVFGQKILQYLKKHGERFDAEIAEAAGLSLSQTRLHLAELAAKGEVMAYHSTRFEDGQKTEEIRCRLTGFTPQAAPGRKSKASKLS